MILVAVFILYAFSLLSKFFIHYYYIYTCKSINTICWFDLYVVYTYVYICLCVQDSLLGIGSFRDSSLQQTDCPFHGSHDLTVVLHLWVGPSEITPVHVGMSSGSVILQVLLRQPIIEISWLQLPCHIQKKLSCIRLPGLLALPQCSEP